MSVESNESKKFKDRLKDAYRVVIIDQEDLKEVGNYQLSLGRFYTYIIGVLSIFSILIIMLIVITPLKRLVPGYGDIEENSQFLELRDKVKGLERELESQLIYTQGLQNMLSGNVEMDLPNFDNGEEEVQVINEHEKEIVTQASLAENRLTRSLSNLYFVPPVLGSISAAFDRSIDHLGVDILAAKDTAIKSISSGVVINSGFTLDTGNTITIQHDNDIISVYKHNSALLKSSGDQVSAGEAIAIIGNTGTLSDGPHLHFELWYAGNPIDPTNYITF